MKIFDFIKKEFNDIKEDGYLRALIFVWIFFFSFCISLIITIIIKYSWNSNKFNSITMVYVSLITIPSKEVKYLTKKTLIDE